MTTKPIIIGISGPSGSGKSLLSSTIISELGSNKVAVITEDSYYKDSPHLTLEERAHINYDHPDSFEHELLITHLEMLRAGKSIEVPKYDYVTHSRSKEVRVVGQHTIVVLEGILLFVNKKLRDLMSMRIFVDTPLDICLVRRLRRDISERGRSVDSVLQQYEATVRPMYLQYIEPSKRHADINVQRGGSNRIAIDMIKAKMRELLIEHN